MSGSIRWGLSTAATALVVPIGLAGWLVFAPSSDLAGNVATHERAGAEMLATGSLLDPLVSAAHRAAPFRPDGRPSRVAYDPMRSEVAVQDYQTPKPVLVLTGVMEGVEPLAVLEGIPGREGPALLGVGDTLAGLKVRRIREGKVTITGMDTTWVLTIRGLP